MPGSCDASPAPAAATGNLLGFPPFSLSARASACFPRPSVTCSKRRSRLRGTTAGSSPEPGPRPEPTSLGHRRLLRPTERHRRLPHALRDHRPRAEGSPDSRRVRAGSQGCALLLQQRPQAQLPRRCSVSPALLLRRKQSAPVFPLPPPLFQLPAAAGKARPPQATRSRRASWAGGGPGSLMPWEWGSLEKQLLLPGSS